MEALVRQQSFTRKTAMKQLRGKRNDTTLHSAARGGDLEAVLEVITSSEDAELKEKLCRQNQSGETALYVAAECGFIDLVKELVKYYDVGSAGIKAINGYDAFHIAAKQGDLEVLKVLMDAFPQLSVTFDHSNTTALYSAAAQGHIEVVNFLLDKNSSLATIARNNGKTALHTSARNGHFEVVKALLRKERGIATWSDKKGQTALHMAVKGQSVEVVDELIALDDTLTTMIDGKGNTALHIATRKGRTQIVVLLLKYEGLRMEAINKHGETALDIAEKIGHSEIADLLDKRGVKSAKSIKPLQHTSTARELKQSVSDIKHEVHSQLEHTLQTRRQVHQVHYIAKRLNKRHAEGLNNAINSTTVVAVLIATVTYAAIFQLPGQYVDDPKHVPPGFSSGEAHIAPKPEFTVFLIFDSLALFISLAVVVVQTSVIAVERRAKKQMMAIINKLMWMACAFVSVAFLSLCYVIVGNHERGLAIGVTVIGTGVMATTLGVMCYWVIMHHIEASNLRSVRRSARSSKSQSFSMSPMSDLEILDDEYKKFYAI